MAERKRLWMSLSDGIEAVDLAADSHRSRWAAKSTMSIVAQMYLGEVA